MEHKRIKVRLTKNSPYSDYGYYKKGDIGYIDGYVNGNAVIILENGKFAKSDLRWIEVVNEEDKNVNLDMKANAPEKIYLSPITLEEVKNVITRPTDSRDIEYTRTDAFIEKAAKFLDDNLYTSDNSSGRGLWTEVIADMGFDTVEEFIEDFRKYMKGE